MKQFWISYKLFSWKLSSGTIYVSYQATTFGIILLDFSIVFKLLY